MLQGQVVQTPWEAHPDVPSQPVVALEVLAWVGLLKVPNSPSTVSICRE